MRVHKFVLDNNIWISYLITGRVQHLIDIISDNDLVVFSCAELFTELKRVLNYPHLKKYRVNVPTAIRLVKKATTYVELVYPLKNYVPLDADDNYVIALALQTNSGFITSGDTHILSAKPDLEKKYKKLRILTKTEFETKFPVRGS